MDQYDVIIIGGGVVGCMTARMLSRYRLRILLIDKESDVGSVTSAANSAMVHAGYDPIPGSLKAKLNVRGNAMFEELSQELDFPYSRSGDYVVAVGEGERNSLQKLYEQGIANGVPGIEIISADETRKRIPGINPETSGAIWAPTGGFCDTFGVCYAAAENALLNGVEIRLETEFLDFLYDGKKIIGIKTNRGDFYSKWVINEAGLYSDAVMHQAGCRLDFQIRPRRGEYLIMDEADFSIDTVLFPVPTEKGKGVLIFDTTHGNTILGPTSEWIDDKEDKSTTVSGQAYLTENVKKLMPDINLRAVIGAFSGLRATGNNIYTNAAGQSSPDFIVEAAEEHEGLINTAGIESPGLTSSPAIAEMVCEILRDKGLSLAEKKDWNPIRKRRPCPRHLSLDERQKLIEKDPRYGKVICRCEGVTEGEIVAEIHAPLPARTYDAIKRRTWAGTGRCQGGFDIFRITAILSRELGISPLEVTKKGAGSEFLFCPSKGKESGK